MASSLLRINDAQIRSCLFSGLLLCVLIPTVTSKLSREWGTYLPTSLRALRNMLKQADPLKHQPNEVLTRLPYHPREGGVEREKQTWWEPILAFQPWVPCRTLQEPKLSNAAYKWGLPFLGAWWSVTANRMRKILRGSIKNSFYSQAVGTPNSCKNLG